MSKDTPLGQNALIEAAIKYAAQGFSPIPLRKEPERSKEPLKFPFSKINLAGRSPEQIERFFRDAGGIALQCGVNNLEVIDVDCKYDLTGTLWPDLWELIEGTLPYVKSHLVIKKTKSNGFHIFYKYYEPGRPLILAARPATPEEQERGEKKKPLIETRGAGGYIVVPPSPGYSDYRGDLSQLTTITSEQRDTLFHICRSFNLYNKPEEKREEQSLSSSPGLSPFADYNDRGDVVSLLQSHGWNVVNENPTRVFLKRPGTSTAASSGNYHKEKKKLWIFSSSTEFEPDKAHSPSDVFILLECGGDKKEAAKKLSSQGYGDKITNYANQTNTTPTKKSPKSSTNESKEKRNESKIELIREILKNKPLKFNESSSFIELNGKAIENQDYNDIVIEVHEKTGAPSHWIEKVLSSSAIPKYNPFAEFIEESQKNVSRGHIDKLLDCLILDETPGEQYVKAARDLFRRWLLGIAASMSGDYCRIMPVLIGKQGDGKTTFFRELLPEGLRRYYARWYITKSKDDNFASTSKLLLNWDEIDIDKLGDHFYKDFKSTLSSESFYGRRPNDRLPQDYRRIAAFCGTSNEEEILSDLTGNTRIIPILLSGINMDGFLAIDKTALFGEIIYEYLIADKTKAWHTTAEDFKALNLDIFTKMPIEELLLRKYAEEGDTHLCTTEIKSELEQFTRDRISLKTLGLALKKLGFARVTFGKLKNQKGYKIKITPPREETFKEYRWKSQITRTPPVHQ